MVWVLLMAQRPRKKDVHACLPGSGTTRNFTNYFPERFTTSFEKRF